MEPGPAFNPALQAARNVPSDAKRHVWREHHDGRLVTFTLVAPDRDAAGGFIIEDVKP